MFPLQEQDFNVIGRLKGAYHVQKIFILDHVYVYDHAHDLDLDLDLDHDHALDLIDFWNKMNIKKGILGK